jgi:hypothetical protein
VNTTTTDADLALLSHEQLRGRYNEGVRALIAAGDKSRREIRSIFHDKVVAIKGIRNVESALRAWESGQRHAEAQPDSSSSHELKLSELKGGAEIAKSLQTSEDPGTVSPGRARLLASGHAEGIRQVVVADQEAAAEGVAREPKKGRKIVAKKAAKAKAKTKKAPKTNGTAAERTPRRAWYNPEATITVLAEGNPRREGGRGHAAWACYRSGMKVQTFLDRVAEALKTTVADAATHLKWDLEREHVKVVG